MDETTLHDLQQIIPAYQEVSIGFLQRKLKASFEHAKDLKDIHEKIYPKLINECLEKLKDLTRGEVNLILEAISWDREEKFAFRIAKDIFYGEINNS